MVEPKQRLNGRTVELRGQVEAQRKKLVSWRNDPDLQRLTGPGPIDVPGSQYSSGNPPIKANPADQMRLRHC